MPLAAMFRRHHLPLPLLEALLSAFEQDTHQRRYPDRAALMDYCRRSANPVGRLLLHLYGVRDLESLTQSDAICSALQLINFWQDLSVDLPRDRLYVPLVDCADVGVTVDDLMRQRDTGATRALVEKEVRWARELMLSGAPLATRLPGARAGSCGWWCKGACASWTRSRQWISRRCGGGRRSGWWTRRRWCGARCSCDGHGAQRVR